MKTTRWRRDEQTTSGRCVRVAITALLVLQHDWFTEVQGQMLPSRDEDLFHFHINNQELFYDTRLLPDGAEITAHLITNVKNRYFFSVDEDDAPVTLTITPCASAVTWRLLWRPWSEEMSGDKTDELFGDQVRRRQKSKTEVVRTTYTGLNVSSYHCETGCRSGVYVLQIKTIEVSGNIRIYASTSPHSDRLNPELPLDADIRLVERKGRRVSLAWDPSPTDTMYGVPVRYCIAINLLGNFLTHCSAQTHILGETPPARPRNAGFGFANEKRRKLDAAKENTGRAPDRLDATYSCIGANTRYTFQHDRPGRFFIDVFVQNVYSNASTSYRGRTIKINDEMPNYTRIYAGKLTTSYLKRHTDKRLFMFRHMNVSNVFSISLQSCRGKMRVTVYTSTEIVKRTRASKTSRTLIENAGAGFYYIEVGAPARNRSVVFNILVSNDDGRRQLPLLPANDSIAIVENGGECNSITLSWHTVAEPQGQQQRYCLYKRKIDHDHFRQRHITRYRCLYRRKASDKIQCRSAQLTHSYMTHQVTGLKPRSTYLFDVYARSMAGITLAYRSVQVTTREHCDDQLV